jgi:hypothetical protein
MTLEEAQQQILELKEELKTANDVAQSYLENNNILKQRVESLQEHNQKLFLRITQDVTTVEQSEPDVSPIEKFLETVTI